VGAGFLIFETEYPMSGTHIIDVQDRTEFGTRATRRLRTQGLIPAEVYGHGDNDHLSLNAREFTKQLRTPGFASAVVQLKSDKKNESALIQSVRRHPVSGDIIHVDFLRVSLSEEVAHAVPLHFVGAEKCPGVKAGGMFEPIRRELEIHAKVRDLPDFIEVDVSGMNLRDVIHVLDIPLPEGCKVVTDVNFTLCTVVGHGGPAGGGEEG